MSFGKRMEGNRNESAMTKDIEKVQQSQNLGLCGGDCYGDKDCLLTSKTWYSQVMSDRRDSLDSRDVLTMAQIPALRLVN